MIRLSDILCESCWDGYKQVGMKKVNGKMVPNCVPVKEYYSRPEAEVTSDSDFKPDTEYDRERGMFGSEGIAYEPWKTHPEDHVEHGAASAKLDLQTGKKSKNYHDPNSPEGKMWQYGYDQYMKNHMSVTEHQPETSDDNDLKHLSAVESMQDEDHEVSMAQSLLDDIIKNATELKEKIGEEEIDLPAWIQDHISQSQNFISQANTNYHEYGQEEDELTEGEYCPECLIEVLEGLHEGQLGEAEYHGRKVPLGKIMRGDVKKFKVFVRDPKSGNVKKVNFGHGGTSAKRRGEKTMKIKKYIPSRRKAFRARHRCATPGPRTKARYWACRTWEEGAGGGGGGAGAGGAAPGVGLVGPTGTINAAPKPKDVKKMRKALNKEKKHD